VELKGQLCAADYDQRDKHAYKLSEDSCQSRSVSSQVKHSHEEKVADDIEHAGNAHGYEGRFGVSQPAEDTAQQIIRRNDEEAPSAYPYVACGDVKGFLGSIHYLCQQLRAEDADHREEQSRNGKDDKSRADGPGGVLRALLPYFLPHGNGYAH